MAKFKNLEAEMVRYGIKIEDIAEELTVSSNTARRKLNGEMESLTKKQKGFKNYLKRRMLNSRLIFCFRSSSWALMFQR